MYIQSIAEEGGMVTVTLCGGKDAFESFRISQGRLKRISLPITEGMTVTEALYGELEHASALTSAVEQAARLLTSSDKSARFLTLRLKEKGFSEEVSEEAVAFMIRKGYLNEVRQACAYAESALRTKLWGKHRISRELYAKGYDKNAIRQAVDHISDEDYDAALQKYLDKALQKAYNVDNNQIRRIAAACERLGHSPAEAVRRIRNRTANDTDEY